LVPRTFLELSLKVKGMFPEHSPYVIKMEPKNNMFLFGSQKNNLMGPFGNVRGTFCVTMKRNAILLLKLL